MFGNLVESGSHTKDFKRRGKFFLATLVFYSVLLVAAGVGSIYAYNVSLDEQNRLEIITMMRFPPAAAKSEPEQQTEPRRVAAASGSPHARPITVREVSKITPYGENREVAREETPTLAPNVPYTIGSENIVPTEIGIPGRKQGSGGEPTGAGKADAPLVEVGGEAPERKVEPQPEPPVERKPPTVVSLGVINGKAISKPVPDYPAIAKAAGAAGIVTVQILVDEEGRVVSARATNGNPMLHKACVEAALRARFTPTLLSHKPVKVSGYITYNFVRN
ncbi:MAG TPA: TonB family protein [Pyrinomonadaceae bacterium]|nr:TonB family protein [Pyrinomonadaceae bacterium]